MKTIIFFSLFFASFGYLSAVADDQRPYHSKSGSKSRYIIAIESDETITVKRCDKNSNCTLIKTHDPSVLATQESFSRNLSSSIDILNKKTTRKNNLDQIYVNLRNHRDKIKNHNEKVKKYNQKVKKHNERVRVVTKSCSENK